MSGAPDFSRAGLDFSRAHFLDHPIWRCRPGEGRYGGKPYHLWVGWTFVWRGQLAAATLCRAGWHHYVTWYRGDRVTFRACRHCYRREP